MPKHKPPSRIRYEKEHPIVSFRLDRETKERLRKVLGKKSFASFVKEGLGVREREKQSLEEEYKKGENEGYEKAKNVYGVYTRCTLCGKEILISTEKEKREADKLLRDRGIAHAECVEKREREWKRIRSIF